MGETGEYRVVPWAVFDEVRHGLERRIDAIEQASRARRDRLGVLWVTVIGGIVCPLAVSAVFTLIHLARH